MTKVRPTVTEIRYIDQAGRMLKQKPQSLIKALDLLVRHQLISEQEALSAIHKHSQERVADMHLNALERAMEALTGKLENQEAERLKREYDERQSKP
ncbi:hypothetical protein HY572_03685 [Candidatus Micrarchaeota archaeon]|nr:hypothetical protein [Candidatus Micrarchaeota archaeon]